MCTNKILIRSNSRFIDVVSAPRLYRYVNCGCCAECQNVRMAEYQLRLYYEQQRCLDAGGFVLIDCLTYSDDYLPRLHRYFDVPLNYGYKCFDSMDVRLFLVRLRQHLRRLGYKDDVFSYFYVGEFGTDERYTKRPHYHIVFFVRNAGITPEAFSLMVSENWYLGRTDGLAWRGVEQLRYNTIDSSVGDSRLSAISSYLAKYLFKSQSLIKAAFHKAMVVVSRITGKRSFNELDYSERLLFQSVRKRFLPFHRQSQGFGLYALQCVPQDYIDRNQKIYFKSGSFVFDIPLPLYYSRKLYFTLKKNSFGTYSWIPRVSYKRVRLLSLSRQLNYIADSVSVADGSKLDPLEYRRFALQYLLVFGRAFYKSGYHSLRNDLYRNPLALVTLPGWYNYTHPRFGLNCLTNKPILIQSKNNVIYKKCLQDTRVLAWSDFVKAALEASELVLSRSRFYTLLDTWLSQKCAFHDGKNAFQDLVNLISSNLKSSSSYAV